MWPAQQFEIQLIQRRMTWHHLVLHNNAALHGMHLKIVIAGTSRPTQRTATCDVVVDRP